MLRGLILAVAMLMPVSVMAFGADGHHAVCEIAYDELTESVRAKVDEILKADPDARFHDFGPACGWPDRHDLFSPLLKKYGPDHFINVPRSAKSVDKCFKKGQETDRCLYTSIEKMISVLKGNDQQNLGKRDLGYPKDTTEALRFLGHWLGDIHQPLHISYGDDRGGNKIPVFGVSGCTSKKDKNDIDNDGNKTERYSTIHTIWDTCIVKDSMSERGLSGDRSDYAKALRAEISNAQRSIWASTIEFERWKETIANESHTLAQGGLVKYCRNVNGVCQYSVDHLKYKKANGFRVIQESGEYEDIHRPVIEMRIKQAGVRLGALLNELFAD
jgi:hypothetical protein